MSLTARTPTFAVCGKLAKIKQPKYKPHKHYPIEMQTVDIIFQGPSINRLKLKKSTRKWQKQL